MLVVDKFKKIYLISNKNENRSIKLSEKVLKFKSLLIEDQEQRLKAKSFDCEIIDISEIKKIELRNKIETLEDKVSLNLDENLYTELLSLRNQLKGG